MLGRRLKNRTIYMPKTSGTKLMVNPPQKTTTKLRKLEAFFLFAEEHDPLGTILFIMGFYFIGLALGWWQ